MPPSKPILVIGGGISGLVCAWRLRRDNFPVLLLEASPRFGGLINTIEQNGFRFDVGPQSFRDEKPMLALLGELGLADKLLHADPRAPRYILQNRRLVAAPLGPVGFLTTPLFGWNTKLKFLTEPFRHTHPPEGDESLASFVRRKFGEDLLQNVAAPFVSGIYAGDPEKLSVPAAFPTVRRLEERYGSLIRGAMKSRTERRKQEVIEGTASGQNQNSAKGKGHRPGLCNFRDGIVTLPSALAAQLGDCARSNAEVLEIWRSGDAFEVAVQHSNNPQTIEVSAVVVATPTRHAARLLAGIDPHFANALAGIEYAAVAQVCAGYRLSDISPPGAKIKGGRLSGFGFLVPRSEALRLLGTVWSSALFPGRTPEGAEQFVALTSFLGGALDPELCKLSEHEIARIAREELASVMRITSAPVTEFVACWQRAIPQYNLGHVKTVKTLGELCSAQSGIFLAGNYLSGPALPACVEQANRTAAEVARFFESRR